MEVDDDFEVLGSGGSSDDALRFFLVVAVVDEAVEADCTGEAFLLDGFCNETNMLEQMIRTESTFNIMVNGDGITIL